MVEAVSKSALGMAVGISIQVLIKWENPAGQSDMRPLTLLPPMASDLDMIIAYYFLHLSIIK